MSFSLITQLKVMATQTLSVKPYLTLVMLNIFMYYQWFIYKFWLMSPGTRCFLYHRVQLQTYEHIFHDKSAIPLHPGTS